MGVCVHVIDIYILHTNYALFYIKRIPKVVSSTSPYDYAKFDGVAIGDGHDVCNRAINTSHDPDADAASCDTTPSKQVYEVIELIIFFLFISSLSSGKYCYVNIANFPLLQPWQFK